MGLATLPSLLVAQQHILQQRYGTVKLFLSSGSSAALSAAPAALLRSAQFDHSQNKHFKNQTAAHGFG